MVILGVDAHKRTHTVVAVDEVGRKLGERTVSATREGRLEAIAWAACRRNASSRSKIAGT